nr:reverse transcriptase domain-containing protein [Tanacetum cinerariifolium]
MPPRMMTRSAGQSTVTLRGRRTGGWTGRGCRRIGEPTGRVVGRTDEQDVQGGYRGNKANGGVGNHFNNQGNKGNQNNNIVNENIQGGVRNVIMNNGQGGCSYKEFLESKPKEYDDYKALMRKELCPNNEMQKLETEFWYHTMVGADHAAYTDHFHELARLVPYLLPLRTK